MTLRRIAIPWIMISLWILLNAYPESILWDIAYWNFATCTWFLGMAITNRLYWRANDRWGWGGG